MTSHTPNQLLALVLFTLLVPMPADPRLVRSTGKPVGNHYVRATAAAAYLQSKGVDASVGWYRQFAQPDETIVDVELLQIDDAMVDASGIHKDWSQVAQAYGVAPDAWLPAPPRQFCPQDPDWLGNRAKNMLDTAISSLDALSQRQALETNTDQLSRSMRPGSRL
jgi:hypothetical protein